MCFVHYLFFKHTLHQILNEIAEHLEISEEFLAEALECYRNKYGACTKADNYVICFEPYLVIEML